MAKSKHSKTRKSSSHDAFNNLILSSLLLLLSLFALGLLFVIHHSGDTPTSTTSLSINSIIRKKLIISKHEDEVDDQERWTEVISWEPRVFIYHNFLSKAECEHLINISKPHLKRSRVVDAKTGKPVDSMVRTSYGKFLQRRQDEIVSSIEKRIADFTFIPEENGEGIHILRYKVGQQYKHHKDYFSDEFHLKKGQRMATVLMYLSNVEEGGETVFPLAKGNFSTPPSKHLRECSQTGIFVKPKMGDALLFWSMKPDGTPDAMSMHGGCPVIKGTKWSATKWLRFQEFAI